MRTCHQKVKCVICVPQTAPNRFAKMIVSQEVLTESNKNPLKLFYNKIYCMKNILKCFHKKYNKLYFNIIFIKKKYKHFVIKLYNNNITFVPIKIL